METSAVGSREWMFVNRRLRQSPSWTRRVTAGEEAGAPRGVRDAPGRRFRASRTRTRGRAVGLVTE